MGSGRHFFIDPLVVGLVKLFLYPIYAIYPIYLAYVLHITFFSQRMHDEVKSIFGPWARYILANPGPV